MSESTGEPGGPEEASPAGIYDFWLGGDANTAADRAAAQRIVAAVPEIKQIAWANRGFPMRAVTWMAQEHGIRQFIDIGAGFPAQRPTHEVARAVARNAGCSTPTTTPPQSAGGRACWTGFPERP